MKRSILSFLFLLGVTFSYSQTTIAIQSFENAGDTWAPITFSTPPCTVGTDVWDYTTSLPGIAPSEGNQFWGIRDLDGSCGSNNFETITLPDVDISLYSDVAFSFDYNALNLDNNDDLKYELFYDGISQGEVIVVDGVNGNSDDTNGWITETVFIPNSITNVSVILSAKNNHDSDRAGFDNVRLGESVTNDNCASSIILTVGNNNTENVIFGTNADATDSGESPTPNCANYDGNDVWYTANIPASGLLTIETLDAGSSIDTGIAVYTGSCGSLTQVDCDDNTGSGRYSLINLTNLPNATIYIRVWNKSNSSPGNFNIVAYTPLCPFTTTWNGSNWDNGTPNSFTSAIVDGSFDTATNGSFESCNCQINTIATVNIRANDYITVYNDLTVNGVLEVRHEGSLVMTDDGGQTSVTGTLNVHKTSTPFNLYDYMYWSSPAVNETIGNVLSASVASRIYRYETSNYADVSPLDGYDDDQNDWVAVGSSTQMSAGIGYIAMGSTSGTFPQTQAVVFSGQVNNGIIQTPISLSGDSTEDQDDYNLIGNPYPSGIDADLLLNNSLNAPVVNGTIYLWTHNTVRNTNSGEQDYTIDDYATYTAGTGGTSAGSGGSEPLGIIASGQGFFIEAITNGSITFNNAMRVNTGNDQFFRAPETKSTTSEKDRIWLNLFTDTGAFNQLLIGFIEGASNTIDRYDGLKIGGGYVSFYSIIDGKNFAVNGKESLTDDEIIPLGFASYVEEGETLKISIAKAEGKLNNLEFDIFLKDNLLNITHNLKVKDYEFISTEKGVFNNRFELMIKNSDSVIENQTTENQLIINRIDDQLIVSTTNSSVISSLTIYDILGRLLFNKYEKYFGGNTQNEFAVTIQNINNGTILLVNAVLENNKILTKKIIVHY